MDATLPSVDILRQLYPDVEIVADIEATAPHATVRQVLGAPVSAGKLMRSEVGRNREAVRRALLLRFVRAGGPRRWWSFRRTWRSGCGRAACPTG